MPVHGTGSAPEKATFAALAFNFLPSNLIVSPRTTQLQFPMLLMPTCPMTADSSPALSTKPSRQAGKSPCGQNACPRPHSIDILMTKSPTSRGFPPPQGNIGPSPREGAPSMGSLPSTTAEELPAQDWAPEGLFPTPLSLPQLLQGGNRPAP